MDLFGWYGPELDLGACLYESATGVNPYKQARELAKGLVKQLFNNMRNAQAPHVPTYGTSYPAAVEYNAVPNFDSSSQSYYVRRNDVPIRRQTPIIQSTSGYSKVNVQQARQARQHWEKDKYYEHRHKPVYIVHPPGTYYIEENVPPPQQPQQLPNPLLKEEWIDYYENLILSKFGFVERLQSNTYVNCAQSYTFVIVYRILGSLLSKL